MSLKIEKIEDKEAWENFLLGCEEKTFLDSWNWGEFQKMMNNKIWRFGVYQRQETRDPEPDPSARYGAGKRQELVAVALIIKTEAKRGTFLFLPHGPNLKRQETPNQSLRLGTGQASDKRQVSGILLEELKKIAKNEGVSFIRIAPIWERNRQNIEIFKKLGFRVAPIHMHPELTWELDITPSEEELLMQMRKTTRYLIRKAQKDKEIEIIKTQNLNDVERFNNLYQKTGGRHHFVPFSLNYLKNQFLSFRPDNQPIRQAQGCPECIEGQIAIFLGKYKDDLVSSGVFVFWQNIAFYHHGASLLKYPKIPVSYLLLWEAIKEAKRRGCQKFNFWGIAPEDKKNHPWAGLTLFKKGFGGYKKEYVKTQDLPLSKRYWVSFFVEKLRKKKRGL
ncbi:MAG: lipid II:glycine glycyltransferase FemX [Candidatus Paceibacterales bacterium]